MRKGRDAAITHRIFVPEVVALIAGAADIERVGEGAQLVGGVEHQSHAVADGFGDVKHIRGFLASVAFMPAMDLVGAIAERVALFRKFGESLRR